MAQLLMITFGKKVTGVPFLCLIHEAVGKVLVKLIQNKHVPLLKGGLFLPAVQAEDANQFLPEADGQPQRMPKVVGLVESSIEFALFQSALWIGDRLPEGDSPRSIHNPTELIGLCALLHPDVLCFWGDPIHHRLIEVIISLSVPMQTGKSRTVEGNQEGEPARQDLLLHFLHSVDKGNVVSDLIQQDPFVLI